MADADPFFDRKLAAIFKAEATEHVRKILAGLVGTESAGGGPDPALAKALFREAHSLKGAARAVGRKDVESICHAMESVFLALDRGKQEWSRELLDLLHEVTRELDAAVSGSASVSDIRVVEMLERLEQPPRAPGLVAKTIEAFAPPPAHAAVAAAVPDTVRISVERLSSLLFEAESLVSVKVAARRLAEETDNAWQEFGAMRALLVASGRGEEFRSHEARLKSLKSLATRDHRVLGASVDSLLDGVKQALMVPMSSLADLMMAAVRELSRSQRKEVQLRIEGGDIEIDRRLLDQLRESLLHLLRNAVDHGIESPADRVQDNKPANGTIAFSAARLNGGALRVTVRDDGAGIDVDRLLAAAREHGDEQAAALAQTDPLSLIFTHGFSTARAVTAVSGRGIGLAIVRERIEMLGGTVTVETERGRGTCFIIVVPTSMATFRAIEVQAGGQSFLLPIAHVARCGRLPAQQHASAAGQAVVFNGEALPLVSLARILKLGTADTQDDDRQVSYAVLESASRRIAFSVDKVVGEQEVHSKPIRRGLTRIDVVAGTAAVASGRTLAILNVASLVRAALAKGQAAVDGAPPAAHKRKARSILLAEDSITSRTLLKNILEMAGYEVTVAVDGAQALEKLGAGRFDAVVSDIEMPNLDGFALTQSIRREPALASLPVILVTSLSSAADRERGAEAGANAYIVKSSFDQGDLIKTLGDLV
jgi:two-component system chemotaxis sensor kinase CheA